MASASGLARIISADIPSKSMTLERIPYVYPVTSAIPCPGSKARPEVGKLEVFRSAFTIERAVKKNSGIGPSEVSQKVEFIKIKV